MSTSTKIYNDINTETKDLKENYDQNQNFEETYENLEYDTNEQNIDNYLTEENISNQDSYYYNPNILSWGTALYSYEAQNEGELSFYENDVIGVSKKKLILCNWLTRRY